MFNNSFSKNFIKGTSTGLSLVGTFACTNEVVAAPGGCKDFCLNFLRCLCPCWDCLFGNQVTGVWYADQENKNFSSVKLRNDNIWRKTRLSNVDDEMSKNKENETTKISQEKCSKHSVIFDLSDFLSEIRGYELSGLDSKSFLERCICFLKKYKGNIYLKKEYKNKSDYKDMDTGYLINLCNNTDFYSGYDDFCACLEKFEVKLKMENIEDFMKDIAMLKSSFKKINNFFKKSFAVGENYIDSAS